MWRNILRGEDYPPIGKHLPVHMFGMNSIGADAMGGGKLLLGVLVRNTHVPEEHETVILNWPHGHPLLRRQP